MFDVIKEILMSEKGFTETNYEMLKKSLAYIKKDLIDSDGNMYLTVGSLIEINNIITGSNNISLRKFNLMQYGFDNMFITKDLIEDKLFQIMHQFNHKNTPAKFYSILYTKYMLYKIHPFYDVNNRTSNILFANGDNLNLLMRQKLKN